MAGFLRRAGHLLGRALVSFGLGGSGSGGAALITKPKVAPELIGELVPPTAFAGELVPPTLLDAVPVGRDPP